MKKITGLLIALLLSIDAFAQTNNNLEKLVETEKEFAKTAESKSTKQAFLALLADDGILFTPTVVNGKEFWKNRPDSPSLLSWYEVK